MINKEEFKNLMQDYYEQNNRVDNLDKIFGCAFDNPIIDWGYKLFEQLLKVYFDKEGYDWIFYYIYDNSEKCYYLNNNRIPLETIDDLWKIVKEHRNE